MPVSIFLTVAITAAEIVLAGFLVTPVDPLGHELRTLLTMPLPQRLPIGKRAPVSFRKYLDPDHVLPNLALSFRVWMSNKF